MFLPASAAYLVFNSKIFIEKNMFWENVAERNETCTLLSTKFT
jgi:hypothetical protein